MANVWRLMAHNQQHCHLPMIQWAIANSRIAIGWGLIGDLTQPQFTTPKDIRRAAILIADGQDNNRLNAFRRPLLGINLWNFRGGPHPFYPQAQGGPRSDILAMQCGDLVILKTNIGPREGFQNSVVMRVTGPYEFVASPERINPPQALPCVADYGYQNQRKAVRVAGCDPQALWNAAGGLDGVRQTLNQPIRGNALVLCSSKSSATAAK